MMGLEPIGRMAKAEEMASADAGIPVATSERYSKDERMIYSLDSAEKPGGANIEIY